MHNITVESTKLTYTLPITGKLLTSSANTGTITAGRDGYTL
jgi:hypothetical protein